MSIDYSIPIVRSFAAADFVRLAETRLADLIGPGYGPIACWTERGSELAPGHTLDDLICAPGMENVYLDIGLRQGGNADAGFYGHQDPPEATIYISPTVRSPASIALAIALAIAGLELGGGKLEQGRDDLVRGGANATPDALLAALRIDRPTGNLEADARRLLHGTPGFRNRFSLISWSPDDVRCLSPDLARFVLERAASKAATDADRHLLEAAAARPGIALDELPPETAARLAGAIRRGTVLGGYERPPTIFDGEPHEELYLLSRDLRRFYEWAGPLRG